MCLCVECVGVLGMCVAVYARAMCISILLVITSLLVLNSLKKM